MFMVDIAVPRDVEAEVADLNDVYLYTIDDIEGVVQENLQSRLQAARDAEKIIDTQVAEFMQWIKSLAAIPSIRALREGADGEDPQTVIEQLARSLTNKFTHAPTTALKRSRADENVILPEAVRKLLDLTDDD
jgi:glutamyl-tRNA reductase